MTVENLELQEQQSDRQELEETLQKLEKHKDKLIQQIKVTRQLCYEESQRVTRSFVLCLSVHRLIKFLKIVLGFFHFIFKAAARL